MLSSNDSGAADRSGKWGAELRFASRLIVPFNISAAPHSICNVLVIRRDPKRKELTVRPACVLDALDAVVENDPP